jgi:hypothetical protein
MKLLSGDEFAKIKACILELLSSAQEDLVLPEGVGADARQERLSDMHAYLEKIKPELIAGLDRITPYFLEEYGDDWVIEKFKSTLDSLIAKSSALQNDNGEIYTDCLKQLNALIEIFS